MQLDALQPGARLDDLEVVARLGRGGMGVVYEARDPRIGRRVAVKVPSFDALQGDALARFEREARAAAAVVHPNVVTVFGVGAVGAWPYLVLELLPGGSLRELMKRRGALGWREGCALAREVALGLEAIHAAGLVHRDLKPENVLLDAQGRSKVTDFGPVRQASGGADLTRTGQFLGTAAYTAPEQIDSARDAEPGADLYALGCVLHELVAGAPPFPGTSYDVMAKHLQQPAPPLSASADVPPALDALVLRLLAKRPEQRPASARAVIDALDALLAAAPVAARRSRVPLVGAVLVALAAAVGVTWRVVAEPEHAPVPSSTETAAVPPPVPTVAEPPAAATAPPPAAEERLPFELRPVPLADGAFAAAPGVNVIALVHDARRGFLTGDAEGGLYSWRESGESDVALPRGGPRSMRVAASGGRVLIASVQPGEALVAVWEWQVGTLRHLRSFPHGLVEDLERSRRERKGPRLWAAAISPDGKQGLVSASTGDVAIFDLETGRLQARLTGAEHQPALAWSQDGRWAFAGDRAARLIAWDLRRLPDAEPARDVVVHDIPRKNDNLGAVALAVSFAGDVAVTVGTDFRVVVTRGDAPPRELGRHGKAKPTYGKWAKTVALSPDGRFAATADWLDVKLWDLRSDRLVGRADAHKVEEVTFVGERRLATAGVAGVQLWELAPQDD